MRNKILNFDHFMIYLCGGMDDADDRGMGWRERVTEQLCDMGFRRKNIFNPGDKPLNNFRFDDLDHDQDVLEALKTKGDWKEIERLSKNTIRSDLRLVDKSDLIILYVDRDMHMCGSYDEMGVARNQKKPMLVVVKGGLQNAPYWLIGRVGYKNIYDNFDDALTYLKKVIKGKVVCSEKSWLFFQFDDPEKTDG